MVGSYTRIIAMFPLGTRKRTSDKQFHLVVQWDNSPSGVQLFEMLHITSPRYNSLIDRLVSLLASNCAHGVVRFVAPPGATHQCSGFYNCPM